MSQETRTHTRSDVSKCVSVCSGGGERREAAAQKPIWRRLLCDSGPRSAAPDEQATGRNTKETGRHTRRLLSSWPGASTQRNHPPGCPASAYTHTHPSFHFPMATKCTAPKKRTRYWRANHPHRSRPIGAQLHLQTTVARRQFDFPKVKKKKRRISMKNEELAGRCQ